MHHKVKFQFFSGGASSWSLWGLMKGSKKASDSGSSIPEVASVLQEGRSGFLLSLDVNAVVNIGCILFSMHLLVGIGII